MRVRRLILHDDGMEIAGESIASILKAAGIETEAWPTLFAKLCQGKDMNALVTAVGAGGGGGGGSGGGGGGGGDAPAAGGGGGGGGGAAAPRPKRRRRRRWASTSSTKRARRRGAAAGRRALDSEKIQFQNRPR